MSNRPGSVCAVELEELSEEEPLQLGYLPGGDAVFEAGEGGLAGQVFVAEGLEGRVAAQAGVVIGVLVAGAEGEEPLTEEHRGLMGDVARLPGVVRSPAMMRAGHPLRFRRPLP